MARNEGLWTCGGICFFVLFVISAGLVGGSFKIVEVTEYGLLQNTISKEIDQSRVYLSGRYFVGLARSFIIYPRPAQIMLFSSAANADSAPFTLQIPNEGSVDIDLSAQYTLRNNTLIQLYQKFGTGYKGRFANAVKSNLQAALTDPSLNITVRNFYNSRAKVTTAATTAAASALASNGADLVAFQILRVSLPTTVETNIITTLVSQQESKTKQAETAQIQINSETSLLVGIINQAIELYTSNQTALAAVITNTANALAKSTALDAASTAYQAFKGGNAEFPTGLGFSNDDVLKYRQLKNLASVPGSSTVVANFNTLNALIGGTK